MKNKRGFIAGMLTMLLIVSMVGTASATVAKVTKELEYRDIKVTLDGEKLDLRDAKGNVVEPFMFEGTNYLPVRALAESLGLSVAWDGSTATVVLTSPEQHQAIYISRTGSKYHHEATCNGGTFWEVPYKTAVGMGLEPCDKCVQEGSIQPVEKVSVGEGMYLVGKDIPAGTYLLTATSSEFSGYWERNSDASGENGSIIANDLFDNTSYVTVKNGEYLTINRATAELQA